MSGRGRGISNAPAWMTRGNIGGGGDNLGGSSNNNTDINNGPPGPPSNQNYHDSFGRLSRGGEIPSTSSSGPQPPPSSRRGSGGGGPSPPPPPHSYDHRRYRDDRDRGRDRRPYNDNNMMWEGRGRGGRDGGGGGGGHHHLPPQPPFRRGGGGGDNINNNPRGVDPGRMMMMMYDDDDNADGDGTNDRRERLHRNKSSSTSAITFRSYEDERDWVDNRRRKRKARTSKFDIPPTQEQIAADAAVLALMNATSNPAATDFAGIVPSSRDFNALPQQTRHARRLYIGHLPPNVTEEELHIFFRDSIRTALVVPPSTAGGDDNNNSNRPRPNDVELDDPILSVYINHERRFCFLEFRTVEMATACLALEGIDIYGKGKVKVKRPNDYNPAMAPKVHPSAIPQLDVSRLGIISGTVQDGPNKVFIGGLHYHLTEGQVLELLQAFGKVKSFHLVKNEPDSLTSKGYCFVEYSDPNVTQVAVMGLNGMDLGGGKVLTARVAGDRSGTTTTSGAGMMMTAAGTAPPSMMLSNGIVPSNMNIMGGGSAGVDNTAAATGTPIPGVKPDAVIVSGYDIETLVDAAMGLRPMPTAPMHLDQFGHPITRTPPIQPPQATTAPALPLQLPMIQQSQIMAAAAAAAAANSAAPLSATGMGQQQQMMMMGMPTAAPLPPVSTALPPGASALDIANAALDAAFGQGASASFALPSHIAPPTSTVGPGSLLPPHPQHPMAAATAVPVPPKTRILVLHNMVSDDDLKSDDDYEGLREEVEEEVRKFGKLLGMKIPRTTSPLVDATALRKIYLEYATIQDAANAERELAGRQFGPNIVHATYHDEMEYGAGRLY